MATTRNSSVTEATAFESRAHTPPVGEKSADYMEEKGSSGGDLERNSPPPLEAPQDNGPPDGGLKAWLQVAGAFFLFVNSWGLSNTFGAYQTSYETGLLSHRTPSDIAWIGSFQAFLLLVVSGLSGPLFDKGYFRAISATGSFFVVFGMMMTSICKEYWQVFLAQGLLVGAGAGCLFVPSVAIVATYFSKRRLFATGLAVSGSSVGGVIYPIVFHKLERSVGFGWATRTIAFIALVTLVLPCYGMEPRIKPNSTRPLLLPRAFKNASYSLFTLGLFLGFVCLYIPFYFIQPYAVIKGIKGELPFYLVPILNATSTAGRILPGYFADRVGCGPLNILVPCTLAAAIIAFGWIAAKDIPGVVLVSAFYGFFSGTFVSLPPSVIVSLTPDLSEVGTRMGQAFAISGLGVLIGSPVAGALIRGESYLGTQLFCGCVALAATVTMIAARVAKTGFILRAKA